MATSNKKINKVIIPAAGWGTRFLPETKAMPKEMLPIVDKPVIQFVVEEVVASGIKNIIIATGYHKRAIEDHFDRSLELENHLREHGKTEQLKEIQDIANLANFIYVRQKGDGYGNALPVLNCEPVIDNDPFAVVWGDEFIYATPPRLKQLIDAYEQYGGIVISAMKIDDAEKLRRYGVADIKKEVGDGVWEVNEIVEKPKIGSAPSNIALLGGYILPPEIFDEIRHLEKTNGEYYLVDAIRALMKKGVPVHACEIKNGKYYDTGNKVEYMKTAVEFALKNPEFGEFKKFLKDIDI